MIKFNLIKKEKPQEICDKIIYLTRDDLIRGLHHTNASEIRLSYFQYGKLSEEQKLNANMIVFTENFTYHILKKSNIIVKRADLFPIYSLVSLEDMDLTHFYNSEEIRYAHNVVYEDEYNGSFERKVLKYKSIC